jgi:hypothetical protein
MRFSVVSVVAVALFAGLAGGTTATAENTLA